MTLIITAITIFTLGAEEDNFINYLIGLGMFPFIGIITTPNIVSYVKNDTSKWKKIFYDKGNLHKFKDSSINQKDITVIDKSYQTKQIK